MKLLERFNLKSPILRMKQSCEKCGQDFACEISLNGCWCSEMKLSKETLQELRTKYKKCLCRQCLEQISTFDSE